MTSRDIMVIEDTEEVNLSMTLIIGMKTNDGLIVASDGLARFVLPGIMDMKHQTTEKVHTVAPKIVMGVAASLMNYPVAFVNSVRQYATAHPELSLTDLAVEVNHFIHDLYKDRIDNPDFFIAVLLAGYGGDSDEPETLLIAEGNIMQWREKDNHPWTTVGTENDRSDNYIKKRYANKLKPKKDTIDLLKKAIADTAIHNKDAVGGHTFVYEITQKGVNRLE